MGKLVYYGKNVKYNVGVRKFLGDRDGLLLTGSNPWVAIPEDELRDFKIANKSSLLSGLIKEIPEPELEWETANAVGDDEVRQLVKEYFKLKQRLPQIDSIPILYKMLEEAKSQDRAKRIINLIQARIDEVGDDVITIQDMRGVERE